MEEKIKDFHEKLFTDHPLLYAKKLKGKLDKNKKLTFYFVKKLIVRLGYSEDIADKCSQAPFGVLAKTMELCHKIVSGEKEMELLNNLRFWLCPELKDIGKKLSDPEVFKDVKAYLNRHVTRGLGIRK